MQIGEHGDRLARGDGGGGGLVEECALVDWEALADWGEALGLLHHLDWQEEEARAVVADHRLGDAVCGVRGGGGADLEARDAHDVGVEGLRVLGPERLVGGGAARANDSHRHLELPAGGRIRVARGGDLGHAVDAEVGVHEFDDRTVAVHAFSERLADEVALVDDLVGAAESAERLLRQLWNVVRRASLQILRVADGRRVAPHLLEHGQVDGVRDRDGALRSERLERGDVRIERRHLLRRDSASVDGVRVGGRCAQVVVGVGLIGELEFLGEVGGRRVGGLGEVQRGLHGDLDGLDRGFEVERLGLWSLLEELDRIALLARPHLLRLAPTLVLGVGGRVALEAVRVHLEDGGALVPDVVDDGATRLERIGEAGAVDLDARHAVV
mmetsp:Transcript_35511/g.75850  ORF Transcript_35511/g.75850 Transcript_35511/m.75850 type:complete len:384 (+) Transcript_35511:768-1919(+)